MNPQQSSDALLDDPQPGTRIDNFTVAYHIAAGMNADVFAVWHHDLRTPLVCKRLRVADQQHAKWRRLLRAEGAALARLNHPGIVRLIAQNQSVSLPYLLLEHVGSKTLRDRLKEDGPLEIEQATIIVQHVGAAVAYAHAEGFLHRDLKPSNIILRAGRPVLLDFGIVWKWKSGRRPPDRSGTPQCLAPEQIRREPLTPRTDVYALGILLFELLTGMRPFRASENYHDRHAPLAERYPQLVEAPLTSRRAGRRLPAKLQQVITRALACDPEARWPSVVELLAALDPFTRTKVWPRDAVRGRNDFAPFEG
ncbi:MAG: serine/threonine protein kinase [Pyrinomonadaceae bacterium]|nr:serine/threonine protein kinase [Pyrinomonadaceae bacterium]